MIATRASCTALVVGNDQMALGAIRALRDAGLRVPEDVSIVGFDDVPEAAYFDPPLTTVRQDFAVLGQQCVEYLTTLIKAPLTPRHQRMLYPTLVTRSSTTTPRAAA
jgi:DNA-binding LacI/PurR family transcriptional regulator